MPNNREHAMLQAFLSDVTLRTIAKQEHIHRQCWTSTVTARCCHKAIPMATTEPKSQWQTSDEKQRKEANALAAGLPHDGEPLDQHVAADRLARKLSARQVQMIAIGGTIGTGLFLGTGKSLSTGGPASMVISYAIVGAIVFNTMLALGEMAAFMPIAGSFCTFAGRFVDDAFGFALTWNYWFNDAVSTASDLTALQLVFEYWNTNFPGWALGLIFLFVLVCANLISVRVYGELEYWLSLLKVITICIFIILGVVVNAGGNNSGRYIGDKNWKIGDAPFVGGIGGFASVFVTASFAYGGTESIAITAGETKNPTKNLPRVVKNVFWRILLFYIISVILIGFNVPYNRPGLYDGTTATSPFTIIFQMAGAKAAGSFINAVILTSVLSAGNHALFAGTRLMYTLAIEGYAPRFLGRLNRNKVPWIAVLSTSSISLLCFGGSFIGAGDLWSWLQSIVGVSNQLSWIAICIASLRFRAALKLQGKTHLLPFKNWTYPYGPWFSLTLNSVLVLVQGWSCFSPSFDAVSFVSYYLEIPVMIVMYVAWKLWKRSKIVSLDMMDLETDVHTAEDNEEDWEDKKTWKGKAHTASHQAFANFVAFPDFIYTHVLNTNTIINNLKMQLLTGDEISSILRELSEQDARQLLNALSTAMAAYTAQQNSQSNDKSIHQPLRTVIQTAKGDTTLVMPVSDSSTTTVKVVTQPAKGSIQGAITVYSAVGELLGVLNAAEITAFRTALATMTMLTRWAATVESAGRREMVVFGAGKQAEWHVRLVLLLVEGVKKVTVVNRTKDRLELLKEKTLDQLEKAYPNVEFASLVMDAEDYVSELEACLSAADIVSCCTPSREPLFSSKQLGADGSKPKFLSLIGSYKPEMQEVDTDTIRLAGKVWVDSREACLDEAGELIRAKMGKDNLIEAGELFAERATVALDPNARLTVFKCVGFALMDLTIAQNLLDVASSKGYGSTINNV
ncbi:Basic amino-acid permease [Saxophila tyrrhenica]|uniref:Basic amino-acid permease n=1 Tax=Saxophila tyrrhenica TaxID=1690608 RepID=A0AAV9PQ09_9PEZI|nr:Basic amino-acid permease [Saxophila tyrrhenica]